MAQHDAPNITREDFLILNQNSQSTRYEIGDQVQLESLNAQLAVNDVYENTSFM